MSLQLSETVGLGYYKGDKLTRVQVNIAALYHVTSGL